MVRQIPLHSSYQPSGGIETDSRSKPAVIAVVIVALVFLSLIARYLESPRSSGHSATAHDTNAAPSQAHLEWADAQFEEYSARLARDRQLQPFADSGPLIDAFLRDANSLHSSSRPLYEESLDGPQAKAIILAYIFDNSNVFLEGIVEAGEHLDEPGYTNWRSDCLSRARTSLTDLMRFDPEIEQLEQFSRDPETVQQVRKRALDSRIALNEALVYAEKGDKFATIVTTDHGEMLQKYVSFELILLRDSSQ